MFNLKVNVLVNLDLLGNSAYKLFDLPRFFINFISIDVKLGSEKCTYIDSRVLGPLFKIMPFPFNNMCILDSQRGHFYKHTNDNKLRNTLLDVKGMKPLT